MTAEIPDCMSPVIGRWIIKIQDEMPLDRLNGLRWRSLLPKAAGTGRNHEADEHGFGREWRTMCEARTADAAAGAAAGKSYWNEIDPEALLERLIAVGATPKEEPTND